VADSFVSEDGKVTKIHGHKIKRVIVPVSLTNSDGTVVNLHFLVDTGADQTVVNTEKVHADLTNARVGNAEGVGGIQKISTVTMPRLSVGPLVQENAPVSFAAMPVEEDGLLGQDFLRHFSVTIDYQNAVFRLERTERKERKHE
jgi:predicted aspartyl protease